jgi:hypothetical protein
MTIERIELLETTVTQHGRRLDDHAKLHSKHIASDSEHTRTLATNAASIAALEKNTEVTTRLTAVMGNLIEALAWASKISKGILWVAAGVTAIFFAAKFAVAKIMGWL